MPGSGSSGSNSSGGGSGAGGTGTGGAIQGGLGSTIPGLSGKGSSGSTPAPTVPLFGAGNFCAQPAGLCGPACSVTCQEGLIAYCTNGQGGPSAGTTARSGTPAPPSGGGAGIPTPGGIVGFSGLGSAVGAASGAASALAPGCTGRPSCRCR
ncbi:hypothetical protein [Roseomonas indoligenes]|uniref:Uncharacterized protein n=1 Tax=Roseomonas indoligenes TaxID=2820811 RepID=A0A940N1V9_9PROT|nr:hypothetical protein [Pararoseomonas indoligenes]MBP0493700.1 hypothetical protein [Pararoseomonas indoligenes]